jgi:glycosidase
VVAPYLKGLPSLFNFDLGYAITTVAKSGRDTIDLVQQYKDIRQYYKTITPDYLDATFVKNHDQTRLLTELKGDINKAKMAASILLTMPGTPYVYYGEEIGMIGDKLSTYQDQFGPDAYVREPFIWDQNRKDKMQTTWEEARYSTDQTVVPFSKQDGDPGSLLNFYRKLISFRNTSPALTYGDIDQAGIHIEEIVSFTRKHENEELLVLHNVSDVEVTVNLENANAGFNEIDFDSVGGKVAVENGELRLPAHTTVILKRD